MKISTKTVQIGVGADHRGSVTVPVYQTATFRHPAFGQSTGYDYSRSGNPTRQILEDGIAALDSGSRGFAYASGMAALTNLLMLFKSGDHIVITEDLYGGTFRLLDRVFAQFGLQTSYVDTSDQSQITGAIRQNTKAVLVESPTNPLLKVVDIQAVSRLAADLGLLTIVDNTFMTPYVQRPLELGADIVVYSASKYISGHNDVIAGLVAVKDEALAEKIYFLQNSVGAVLGPQDSWLAIRGLKTLGIRMDRQMANAGKIAAWLKQQAAVNQVYYPGLDDHPGHELMKQQAAGFGAMISFEAASQAAAEMIINRVRLISFAESLGGVESLITFPAFQTHGDMDPAARERMGINNRLLRLSVGIEDCDDLVSDLRQALEG